MNRIESQRDSFFSIVINDYPEIEMITGANRQLFRKNSRERLKDVLYSDLVAYIYLLQPVIAFLLPKVMVGKQCFRVHGLGCKVVQADTAEKVVMRLYPE